MDPRFNTARFGPWSNGPITDPNEPPVPTPPVDPGPQRPTPNVLPFGGAGLDGGGWNPREGGGGGSLAWDGIGSTMAFDDGGMIPSSPDDEADGTQDDSGTVDPFNLVRKAVQDFRQKIGGQPRVFYPDESSQEDTQSFDEGGPVEQSPDQDQQGVVGPGPKPVDPRETTKYLAGDGAIQPAVALALEQMTDPQRQMQPGQRMMATAQMLAQKSPDAAGAYLQAKRILFNGFAGATSSALKKGDMALAAHNATQAFAHVPNSHNVKFAPHPHGLVMHAQPHQGGATPQQAQPEQQAEAPQADDDAQEEVQSAAGGGVIETDETNPSALYQQQQPGSAASYDEGGDVEGGDGEGGDEVTGTVTPPGPEWLQGAQQARPAPTPAADERSIDQIAVDRPTPLSTEQAAAVVHPEAFDKVVDKGWLRYLAEKVGMGGRMADTAYTGAANAVRAGQGAVKQGIADVATGLEEGYTGQPAKPAAPPAEDDLSPVTKGGKFFNPVDVDPNRPDNNPNIPRSALAKGPPAPTSRPTPAQGARAVDAQGRNTDEIAAAEGPDAAEARRVTAREDLLDKLAMKRFPWLAGDAHAREAYKAQLRAELYKTDQAKAHGLTYEQRVGLQENKHAGEMEKVNTQQAGLTDRNRFSNATKVSIEQLKERAKQGIATQHDFMSTATKIKADTPGMSIEDAIAQTRTLAASAGVQMQEPQQGDQRRIKVYSSGPLAGKRVYVNPDGTVEPVGQ